MTDKIDKARKQETIKGVSSLKNLSEIIELHDNLMSEKSQHARILKTLMDTYLPEFSIEIIEKWKKRGQPDLKKYAPYCRYFDKATFIITIGSQLNLINRRKKNKALVDGSYLPYLPFCDIFATGDKELYSIAKNLTKPDQKVMSTEELKHEIQTLPPHTKKNI